MDENAEYCAIVAFTKDNDPTCEKNRQQLYALWTAYCMPAGEKLHLLWTVKICMHGTSPT